MQVLEVWRSRSFLSLVVEPEAEVLVSNERYVCWQVVVVEAHSFAHWNVSGG